MQHIRSITTYLIPRPEELKRTCRPQKLLIRSSQRNFHKLRRHILVLSNQNTIMPISHLLVNAVDFGILVPYHPFLP